VTEARTGIRFPMDLPIRVHIANSNTEHQGRTGNVSAAGVYILVDAALEVGSNVEFDITFPADVIGAKQDVGVHCRGRVVRSELADGANDNRGVACVIDSYKFIRDTETVES
jgi:hypothetical protein